MQFGFSFIGAGIVLVLAFVYINMVLQPRWFPNEIDHSGQEVTAEPAPISHATLGIVLLILLFSGVIMITTGCVEIGILRSRG